MARHVAKERFGGIMANGLKELGLVMGNRDTVCRTTKTVRNLITQGIGLMRNLMGMVVLFRSQDKLLLAYGEMVSIFIGADFEV